MTTKLKNRLTGVNKKALQSLYPTITDFMEKHDNSKLYEVKFRETNHLHVRNAVYGNCKHPLVWRVTREPVGGIGIKHMYRISITLNIPGLLKAPRNIGWKHYGIPCPETVYGSAKELLLWIFFHEYYHFLAGSGQIPVETRDERMADAFAYEMVRNSIDRSLVHA